MRETVTIPIATDDELCCASVIAEPLSQDDAASLARVLAALSDPVRLRLYSLVAA